MFLCVARSKSEFDSRYQRIKEGADGPLQVFLLVETCLTLFFHCIFLQSPNVLELSQVFFFFPFFTTQRSLI